MTEQRTGEAFELDEQLTVLGPRLAAGQHAPDFELDVLDDDDAIRPVRLSDSAGSVRLLSTVNSLDTPVCDVETRHWDTVIAGHGAQATQARLPADVVVYTVSMDLPFAQARWRGADDGHTLLSSHRSEQFGTDYGVLIKEWRMLQRAVFVIDGSGTITYAEYVADQMEQPSYEPAVEAVQAALRPFASS